MLYKKRHKYKYNLHSEVVYKTGLGIDKSFESPYISFSQDGLLTIKKGYAWDGPSGPTIDTKNFLRGSLVHDALYQLMREQVLPLSFRKPADDIMRDICLDCGMSKFRAWYVHLAVRLFGNAAAAPDLLKAP